MTTLNDAQLYLPLTTTLVPTNGTGSATFTRTTSKRVFDNEGKLINAPSGAAGFSGARMVRNHVSTKSEDFTHSSWLKGGGCTIPSANILRCANATGVQYMQDANAVNAVAVGEAWLFTYRVQYIDIQYVQIAGSSGQFGVVYCNFDIVNGDYTATGCTASITSVSAGVWDISVLFTATGVGTSGVSFIALAPSQAATRFQAFIGDGIKSLGILRASSTNVSGQSDQTASEYVSVGVLPAPYHGAGIDGVKWFTTHKNGSAITDADLLGISTNGAAVTNTMLYCRDFTNAVWVKSNATAARTNIGLDNIANSCSLLTATAANATILQTITAAATAGCTGFWVKRSVGTGIISITRDGGTTWTDITNLINSSTFTKVSIENTSVLNPSVGFKITTSGDAIIVDAGLNHLGTELDGPIFTTSAAVTVNADVLTIPTTGNISDSSGTILATVKRESWTKTSDVIVGSSTTGLHSRTSGSCAKLMDGTRTANVPNNLPSGTQRVGAKWSGTSMVAFANNTFSDSMYYDGSFGLTSIQISGGGTNGNVRDVAVWTTQLTDAEMVSAVVDNPNSGSMTLWSKTGFSRVKVQDPYSRMSPVRFHPGHYWNVKYAAQDNGTLDGGGNIAAASWQTLLTTLESYNAIRGLTWRTSWVELETADGVYGGMAALKKRCEDLAAIGKYFIVHVITRTFDGTRAAPVWARNATYSGGDHPYGSTAAVDGYNINWYDANVQAKTALLAQEIANQLSVYSNFEGVILMEAAYGTRIGTIGSPNVLDAMSGAEVTAYFAGMLGFASAVKTAQPSLLSVQYSNVRTQSDTHIPNLVAAGCGIGGPDLWVQPEGSVSPAWAENDVVWPVGPPQGLYRYFHDYLNQIPLVIHCQPNDYRWPTKANVGNYVPTIQDLLDSAKTAATPNLQVNYLIWTEDAGGEFNATLGSGNYPNFANQVLAKLSESAQLADPAGGLNANYPSIYV